MENTAQEKIRRVINNPANNFSKTTKDLLETLAKQLDLYKIKADKWDKLDEEIGEFYKDENNTAFDPEDLGDLTDIGEVAARAFGYL